MKVKTDFITNSSSASFLIAIKKDTSSEYLSELFKPSVKSYFADIKAYDYDNEVEWWEEQLNEEDELTEENLLPLIVKEFMSMFTSCEELDTWKAIVRYVSNEDSEGIGNFIYSYLHIKNNDKVKVKADY